MMMMTEDQLLLLECLADDEEWKEWEQKAQEYNVTISYYIAEFV
jgi:hypothetical protein